jgi:1-acyl-sn-glycerol-3-phosphate acyltransferase
VLVVNHQSLADVAVCMGLHRPFKFVSKASLFSLPLVGWAMRMLRYVRLERGRPIRPGPCSTTAGAGSAGGWRC